MPDSKSKTPTAAQTAKDYGLLFTNYLGSLTGYWGNYYQNATTNKMSPEEQADLLQKYRVSLGIDGSAMPTADGFATYVATRAKSADAFSTINAPDGTSIAEKAKAAPAEIGAKITAALELRPETIQAQKELAANIKAAQDVIEDPEAQFHPEDLIAYLHELKAEAHKAIVAQHEAEKKAIEDLFTSDPAFPGALGADAAQAARLKTEMLDSLAVNHKKELEAFDKSMNEPLTKMHEAAQKERERVAFLATLYENNEKMRAAINRLYEENKQKHGGSSGVAVSLTGKEKTPRAIFKGIKPGDLMDGDKSILETITGRKIQKVDDNTYSMSLPNRFFSPNYYHSSHNKMKADMLGLAGAVRADGHSHITMDIEHKDPKHALKMARTAYEACREVGFDDKNIIINVNGQKKSAKELFGETPSGLTAVEARATHNKKVRSETAKGESNEATTQRFRKVVTAHRAAAPGTPIWTEAAKKEQEDVTPARRTP